MIEIWKPVVGYEGRYSISNLGNVRSYVSRDKDDGMPYKTLKIFVTPLGYRYVSLYRYIPEKECKSKKIHRLVAEAFLTQVDGKRDVNHINADKSDNRAANLEWCTESENTRHAFRMGIYEGKKLQEGICIYEYCTKKKKSKEMCRLHYYRYWTNRKRGWGLIAI